MKHRVYSFGRFYDPGKVQEAVKVLLNVGIPRSQIKVLNPASDNHRSNINAPEQKHFAFLSALGGLCAGLFFGSLIFVLPSFIWDYSYKNELAVVGLILFLGVGLTVGLLHSLQLSRRRSGNHVIGPDEHGVFVTIHDGQEDQLNRAKDEFNRLEFA